MIDIDCFNNKLVSFIINYHTSKSNVVSAFGYTCYFQLISAQKYYAEHSLANNIEFSAR